MSDIRYDRKRQLLEMWRKIREWVKSNCRFNDMKRFDFPHDPYHWTAFEIYPNGECAILRGSHGNPGVVRPVLICGTEEFWFSSADNAPSWYGRYEDLAKFRKSGPTHFDVIRSYSLLEELFRNWDRVKSQIKAETASDDRLAEFIP